MPTPMSDHSSLKIEIKANAHGSFNLTNVASSPRTATPMDVKMACENVQIIAPKELPGTASMLVQYLITDFFCLAHRTGLYNRQPLVFESIARITKVEATQLMTGFFTRRLTPSFDLSFIDQLGRALLFAHLAEPLGSLDFDQCAEGKEDKHVLTDFIWRAQRLQAGKGCLNGIFLCLPSPFSENVLNTVSQWTHAYDPVARYESILPKLQVSINLLEMSCLPQDNTQAMIAGSTSKATLNQYNITLIHPNLQSRRP